MSRTGATRRANGSIGCGSAISVAESTAARVCERMRRAGTLLRGDVCRADPAVDEEGRSVDVRRLVAGEKECSVGDLLRPREAAHRDVYQPPLAAPGIGEQLRQQRRLHRPGTKRV